jgi:serine/threonine-protein kinase
LFPRDPEGFGRYRLISELGAGGVARVYLAMRDGAPGLFALKQLQLALESHPTAGLRFRREAQLASLLNHPNIARVDGAGIEGGRFSIVTEFIAGQTVDGLIRKTRERSLTPRLDVALTIACRVLDALEYAHDLRSPEGRPLEIVHRDLTPRNVMVSYRGEVKVIDFGVARSALGDFHTAPGMLLGTPRYMSPEQAAGSPVDRRSDLYTVGAVLFELLTGATAVRELPILETLAAIAAGRPPRLASHRSDLPPTLEAVIARALAKDPGARFANASEMRTALIAAAPARQLDSAALAAVLADLFPQEIQATQEMTELATSSAPTVLRHVTLTDVVASPLELESFAPTNLVVDTPTDPLMPTRSSSPRVPVEQGLAIPPGSALPDRTTALEVEIRKLRRRVQLGIAVVGALSGALVVTVVFLLRPDRPDAAVEVDSRPSFIVAVPPAPPRPRPIAAPEHDEPAPPPAGIEEHEPPIVNHGARPHRTPTPHPSQPKAAAPKPGDDVRAFAARYERGELSFIDLLNRVKAAASEAPPDRRKSAQPYVNRAEISSDIGALKRGIDILFPP